ncbi:MAG: bifunctional phosphoribosyl-AMP cyclohydrolase/phosphoribosyl-ATP diphosphatase HisIE [Pseudomonadota bacterium]
MNVDFEKMNGLVPAIVQDAVSGQVLMLGYMNEAALAKTQDSGLVTFYSRSRQCLWTKGETSGNHLELKELAVDCDRDTILVTATPRGPTCHLGLTSCFGEASPHALGFLAELERVIAGRRGASADSSYTALLFKSGTKRIAQKVGEEGVECALAAVAGDEDELRSEAADLLYHLSVLLADQDLSLADVARELRARHSG